jgi:phenylacetate-CoA ligase
LRGEPVAEVARELEASQHWPLERLEALQWERMQRLVAFAYATVPYYRRAWDAVGFQPGDLRTRDDWRRLPMLDKVTLQERRHELLSSRPQRGLLSPTSGSTGLPTQVYRSHRSWAHGHANKFRQWRWFGVEAGERYAYFWGLAHDDAGRREASVKDLIFNRDRCSAFAMSPAYAGGFYERLRAHPATYAYGYPSTIVQFADEIALAGLDGPALGWKGVFTTAELLLPEWRERIESTFGCRVGDNYGCAECCDPGIECERGSMHATIESTVVDTAPLPQGHPELVLTDLHNYSQPLIRYRVGDMVEPPTETACACGRGLPLLGRPIGRSGDNLVLPDGRQLNCHTTTYLFKHHGKAGHVREYQFVQHAGGRIELRIHPGPTWSDEIKEQLAREAREAFGTPIEISTVERFERRGRGKHRDFVRAEDLER